MAPLLAAAAAGNDATLAASTSRLHGLPFMWGGNMKRLCTAAGLPADTPFHAVLAADAVGVGEGVHTPALIKTFTDAARRNPAVTILLAYRPRARSERTFFAALGAAGWRVDTVATYSPAAVAVLHAAVARHHHPAAAADDALERFAAHADVTILQLHPPP